MMNRHGGARYYHDRSSAPTPSRDEDGEGGSWNSGDHYTPSRVSVRSSVGVSRRRASPREEDHRQHQQHQQEQQQLPFRYYHHGMQASTPSRVAPSPRSSGGGGGGVVRSSPTSVGVDGGGGGAGHHHHRRRRFQRRLSSSTSSTSPKSKSRWSPVFSLARMRVWFRRLIVTTIFFRLVSYLYVAHRRVVVDITTSTTTEAAASGVLPQDHSESSPDRLLVVPSSALLREQFQNHHRPTRMDGRDRSVIASDASVGGRSGVASAEIRNWDGSRSRSRAEERRRRTRPPPAHPFSSTAGTVGRRKNSSMRDSWYYRSEPETLPMDRAAAKDGNHGESDMYDWDSLCRLSCLDARSRVLITGLLTQSVGPPLALLMARQCRVEHIAGADAIFPNIREYRMTHLDTSFRQLQRQIANLQMIVPDDHAVFPSRKVNENIGRDSAKTEWIRGFRPTHIVHLEAEPFPPQNARFKVMEGLEERLYASQKNLAWIQQLLDSSAVAGGPPKTEPPIFLHVGTSSSVTSMTAPVVSATYHKLWSVMSSFLELPSTVYGPLVPTFGRGDFEDGRCIYVDDAVAAILLSLSPYNNTDAKRGAYTVRKERTNTKRWLLRSLKPQGIRADEKKRIQAVKTDRRLAQTMHWELSQEDPYGPPSSGALHSRLGRLASFNDQYVRTYGVHETQFPCASSCHGSSRIQRSCSESPLDDIVDVSRNVTESFAYVVYMANFSSDLENVVSFPRTPKDRNARLRRVAYVSGKSRLVRTALSKKVMLEGKEVSAAALERYNGKIRHNGWTLIWLPRHDDHMLSDADYALPRIDPARLMHESVTKAMYVEGQQMAQGSNLALYRIIAGVDHRALPVRYMKERRSGYPKISRQVTIPAERARHAVLFSGEPEILPKSAAEFVKLIGGEDLIPKKQISFYQHVSHWIQTNNLRPVSEIRGTVYQSFPFQWVAITLLVHDLTMEQGRRLRCEWYDEYLYWGESNRDAEELSLAYVLARWRIGGSLGPPLVEDNESDDSSWQPLLTERGGPSSFKEPLEGRRERALNRRGAEIYVRIMQRKPKEHGDT